MMMMTMMMMMMANYDIDKKMPKLTVSWNISSGAPVYLKLEAWLLKAPAEKQALFP